MRLGSQHIGPIGLDIGSRAIRAIQLRRPANRRGSDPPQVAAAARVALKLGEAADSDSLRAKVAEALVSRKFSGREVVTCLPAAEVLVKNLRLPQMPEEELEEAVMFEARDRFAQLGADCAIRFFPAGPVGAGRDTQQEVVVLAAESGAIDARIRMLSGLGLVIAGLEPPANAFFRPFNRFLNRADDAETSSAFIDMGDRGTQIIITRGNNIVFLKRHALGGSELDQRVAAKLDVTLEEAAALRRKHLCGSTGGNDGARSNEIFEAIQPSLDQLGKEIALCQRYCAVTFRGDRPANIICGGSEAGSRQVLQHLARVTETPMVLADPLRGLTVGDASPLAQVQDPAEWTTAVGLALKSRRRTPVEKAVA